MPATIRTTLLAALTAALLAPLAEARVSAEQLKDIKAQFKKTYRDLSTRDKAIRLLGRCDHPETVKMLLKYLAKGDPLERRLQSQHDKLSAKVAENNAWREKVIKQGATFSQSEIDRINKQHKEDAAELLKVGKQLSSGYMMRLAGIEALEQTKDKEALELIYAAAKKGKWQSRTAALHALIKCGTKELSLKHLKGSVDDKDILGASGAMEVLARHNVTEAMEDMQAVLASKKAEWTRKAAAARALSIYALHKEPKHAKLAAAVTAIVTALQGETTRLAMDYDAALKRLTGSSFDGDAAKWKAWHDANKDKLEDIVASREGEHTAASDVPKMSNTVIRSDKVVILLDINNVSTGSMATVTSYIENLPKDYEFTIIAFHAKLFYFSPKLVKNKKGMAKRVSRWLNANLKTDDNYRTSAVHTAIDAALKIGGKTPDKAVKKGPDTIVLMCSGELSPTHGKVRERMKLFKEVYARCLIRQVRVHIFGIGSKGDWGLLEAMANATGGNYEGKRIERPGAGSGSH